MPLKNLLAVDIGASSGRAIIGAFDGGRFSLREIHRFPNEPVTSGGLLQWDILRLLHEIKAALRKCVSAGDKIAGFGIDTWGVDYGLLDANGQLLYNPVHYRDSRTDGITARAELISPLLSKSALYSVTGIQQLNFNTIYQLIAERERNPGIFEYARHLLFIPDLLNYYLCGNMHTEYTIASTGALLDAGKRNFSDILLSAAGIPREIFGEIVFPGNRAGKLNCGDISLPGAEIINTASHDTASAVLAAPYSGGNTAYLSSGTWSLMGCELDSPCLSDAARDYNFTNEGGAYGNYRFLKNIMGLWLLQESKRQWEREGKSFTFDALMESAMAAKPFDCLINPDDETLSAPGDMPSRIARLCRESGQREPEGAGGIVRCIYESLALRYRWTLEKLGELTGCSFNRINVVGGGAKDALLCQMTADACGVNVIAGPSEATAIGNIAAQAIALGELSGAAQAREVIGRSFDCAEYKPGGSRAVWDEAYGRFLEIAGNK